MLGKACIVTAVFLAGMLGAESARPADSDMTLDLVEIEASASARFDQLDQDGDASLEPNEVQGVMSVALFNEADTDKDGKVSKEEYLVLVEKLFKQADVDHDGSLTVDELKSRAALRLRTLIG